MAKFSAGKKLILGFLIVLSIAIIISLGYVFIKKYRSRQLCYSMIKVLLFEKEILNSFAQIKAGTPLKTVNMTMNADNIAKQMPEFKSDINACYQLVIRSCRLQEILARQKYIDCYKNIFEKNSLIKEALNKASVCKQYSLNDVDSTCYQQTDQYIKIFQRKYQIRLQIGN